MTEPEDVERAHSEAAAEKFSLRLNIVSFFLALILVAALLWVGSHE